LKTISIAMATYNGAKFIQEQLDSLARQTYLPYELVVTDDGSTDNTIAIITEFAAKSPFPVRVVINENNLGWRANFIKAASLCHGDYIAFCDQDDLWFPEKLKTCIDKFVITDVLLVYHNASVVDKNLQPIGEMQHSATSRDFNYPQSIEPWKNVYGYTLVFNRVLLEFGEYFNLSVDFFNYHERVAHDQWYFFLASCLGNIYYLAQPLVLYRRHEATATAYVHEPDIVKVTNTDIGAFKSYAIAAETRALIMAQIAVKFDRYNKLAASATKKYEKLAFYYNQRYQLYITSNIFYRIYQCSKLICSGAYKSKNKWGVGFKALGRDVIFGVFFPKKDLQISS